VRAGHVAIDAGKVTECRARVDATTQGCDWIAPTLAPAPAECTAAVSGKLAAGEHCTSSLECTGAMHCAAQGATSAGTCKPPQELGASCGAGVDSLATYLTVGDLESMKPDCADFCSLSTHRCEAVPPAGSACRASVNCARDQLCAAGRCQPRSGAANRAPSRGKKCSSDLAGLLAPAGKPLTLTGRTAAP
jgi:hypothetical protein